ncbi:MAG: hypothetical protein JW745_10150 [Sedimentisphaerales bacterium]|nr:hypothetical protein [Sedimentisphaerales bacterium]MBN2842104.1 hypothetical protein [Sedimentisphaerales bacterium]
MKKILLLILLTITGLTGCHKPAAINNPLSVKAQSDTVWLACKEELRDRGFEIDFQNRKLGIIESKPLISRQWFEFWKKDVVDAGSLARSSTQTTNRIVSINISGEDTGQIIKCTVHVNKQFSSSIGGSAEIRTEDNYYITTNMLEKKDSDKETIWQPAGNDTALEQAILRSIKARVQ